MNRHELLARLHEDLQPRTYLETGINTGRSLSLSRASSVGIDPEFSITEEVQADVHLARTSSDEFFARRRPLAHLPVPVVDLAFVDGMHLAEYALRDVVAVERFTSATSVLVIDDVLPRKVVMANRKRSTTRWTGDVYKATAALRTLRPDLVVVEIDTQPTGTCVLMLPDAARGGVLPGYDDWVATTAVLPDPQDVPAEVLQRTRAMAPEEFLAAVDWTRWRRARQQGEGLAGARTLLEDLIRKNDELTSRVAPGA
ncbi:class I SAM-dependent methyltransferase [Nocardioides sp. AX2bis]|uniref:class I SAM-dependent methyltransferase n=1 Tax=Nocardioides sp. AX2bis TaxID=2653157 RepID=UPI0012F0684C|nr:class I SAM-dependent methyltransferase [Nocardioides sp. AX2bis]VXC14227.1 Methyltransferase domain-containing protein [Nocardioides sp. AX2bis]